MFYQPRWRSQQRHLCLSECLLTSSFDIFYIIILYSVMSNKGVCLSVMFVLISAGGLINASCSWSVKVAQVPLILSTHGATAWPSCATLTKFIKILPRIPRSILTHSQRPSTASQQSGDWVCIIIDSSTTFLELLFKWKKKRFCFTLVDIAEINVNYNSQEF